MKPYTAKKLPKNTTEAIVTIPWSKIQEGSKKAFETLSAEVEAPGYRKGKAPAEIAKKHLPQEKVYEEAMRVLLPALYEEVVRGEELRPVINPKIELVKAKDNEDWEVKFTITERPTVTLGEYKAKVKEVKAKAKKEDIWVPGKDAPKKEEGQADQQRQRLLNEVLEAVLKEAKVEISDLILEEELSQRLATLVDDVHKLGLSLENYLKSRNTTIEAVRESYRQEIENTYKLEFILAKIADDEKLEVGQAELNKLFETIKGDAERKQAEANSYWYASILRKQKTLDFLMDL